MKKQVFVLVPYEVAPAEIGGYLDLLLEKHRVAPDDPAGRGRYNYLVGALMKSFNDSVAEGRLPPKIRRSFSGNICERGNLPANLIPAALVTPDGQWHDQDDFGWRMTNEPSEENRAAMAHWQERYSTLIAMYAHCWVIEVWAHL